MKRIMFYSIVALQIIFVLVLVFQFEGITSTGDEIEILTKMEYSNDDDSYDLIDTAYPEYEINDIPEGRWSSEKEAVSYNDKVYVLLKKSHDDFYKVETASTKKVVASGDDQVVVIGRTDYPSNSNEPIRVNYDFNKIENIEQFGEFKNNQTLKVTLLVSQYGQYKITNVEAVK